MITLGIDLSANPKKTGVAWVDWKGERATVTNIQVGMSTDDELVEEIRRADKTGIDCPLGWPSKFIDYVTQHRDGHVTLPERPRRELCYRETDLFVTQVTGVRGLPVTADRIGSTAMRCAAILSMLAAKGYTVDRSGSGPVVEVYPAASLARWKLNHKGYKRPENVVRRGQLIAELLARARWLELGAFETACRESDDALDAVLCAVTARLASAGLCSSVPANIKTLAQTEGWIALPDIQPEDLPAKLAVQAS
jgi:predicted nuclease with RNAse H fold